MKGELKKVFSTNDRKESGDKKKGNETDEEEGSRTEADYIPNDKKLNFTYSKFL